MRTAKCICHKHWFVSNMDSCINNCSYWGYKKFVAIIFATSMTITEKHLGNFFMLECCRQKYVNAADRDYRLFPHYCFYWPTLSRRVKLCWSRWLAKNLVWNNKSLKMSDLNLQL